MNSSSSPDISTIRKAALLYSRGKWGNVTLDDGVAIVGLGDDRPRAYVFTAGVKSQRLISNAIERYASDNALDFVKCLLNILDNASYGKLKQEQYLASKTRLLDAQNYGTIVVRSNTNRHPIIMAYDGMPFTVVGRHALANRHPQLHYALTSVGPQTNYHYRVGDGDGYPHFYVEVPNISGAKLYSLFDCDHQVIYGVT